MLCPRAVRHVSSEVEDMDTSEARWSWFYLAECGVWHMFEINQSAACSVTSEQIEQNYNRNQLGVMEFCTAKYTYKLDFSGTKSCDEADQLDNWQAASHKACAAFRNKLQVRTIPVFKAKAKLSGWQLPAWVLFSVKQHHRFICDNLALPVPVHWERINTEEPYQLITLGKDTFEYKEVMRLFERTMDAPIRSIQRIQNLDLWEFFCRKKAQLRKIKRVMDIEEKMLFHGTGHSNVQAICTYNFDWRLTGSHGDIYGKGSYFARDAKYSSKFCHTTANHNVVLQKHGLAPAIFQGDPPYKSMFLARVLVGDYTVGQSKFCRPPSKDTRVTNFYDSCVDDIANPKIFVIFDCNQIYPEYLIEFC